ncbi:MAG: hypothetical protein M0R51_11715 [Clostridia bacterium]|jgi:hypothetical protein|nr:hypothetical protein [Clostridia bacterium]
MIDEDLKKQMIELREKNTVIKLVPTEYGDYDNETTLMVTHNGHQFQAIDISQKEAEKIVSLLKEHFSI